MSFDASNPDHRNHFTQLVLKAFMAIEAKRKRRRKPIIAIRKDPDSPYYPWIWSCQICPGQPELGTNFDKCVDWQSALTRARTHAHNHHRSHNE